MSQLFPANFLVKDYNNFLDKYGSHILHIVKASTEPTGEVWVMADIPRDKLPMFSGDNNIIQKDLSSYIYPL